MQSELPSDFKVGDVIQAAGPSVPKSMHVAFWRVESIMPSGNINLSHPFRDRECKIPWFSPFDRFGQPFDAE